MKVTANKNEFTLYVSQESLPEVVCEFVMLKEQLKSKWVFEHKGVRHELIKSQSLQPHSTYTTDGARVVLALADASIDYLLHFLLSAFRDKISPVSHVHVYFSRENKPEYCLTLVLDWNIPIVDSSDAVISSEKT